MDQGHIVCDNDMYWFIFNYRMLIAKYFALCLNLLILIALDIRDFKLYTNKTF
jgi:hypothetical protein